MNKNVFILMAVLMMAASPRMVYNQQPATEEKSPIGKELFINNKCSTCHTIAVADIKKVAVSEDATGLMDLSAVGSARQSAWMNNFLLKIEKKDGKKHPIKFKGSLEELSAITEWLESLKPKTKEVEE